jgi:acetyltransferase-like isoleucine patch superfamily enzyme
MAVYVDEARNISIKAEEITVGNDVSWGEGIRIELKGRLKIGDYCRIGGNTEVLGNNVTIGDHLYLSSGLRVGGGGRQNPDANLTVGSRCTIHNNFINVCEPVILGDDVGLSPETSILTHGYWMSVLDGYPAQFSGVTVGNGTIIGYRSLLMMGIIIADNCVVGAQSLVSKSLCESGIYGGVPARFIRSISPLPEIERREKVREILAKYRVIAAYHDISIQGDLILDYPFIQFRDFRLNVETFEYEGIEDDETDDLRDFLRKWGIRIYTARGFSAKYEV